MPKRRREEYVAKMVKMGIFERDARIYMALLGQRELTAMEIHKLTNIPRTKVYEITQRMIRAGMCIEKQMGGKKKYQAVDPTRAFAQLVREQESDLEEKRKLAKSFAKMVYPIYSRGSQIVDTEYVEVIKGMPSIHERYVSLLNGTKHELLGFVKRPYVFNKNRQIVEEQENAEFRMLKRGASARVLYELPEKKEREFLYAHVMKCIKKGEKARVMEDIPTKMYVFDQKFVLMALDNVKLVTAPFTMLVVEHPSLALAATILFNHLWAKAKEAQRYKDSKRFYRKKGG